MWPQLFGGQCGAARGGLEDCQPLAARSVEVQPPPNHTRLATTRPMSGGLRNSPWRRWRSKAPAVVGRGEQVFFVRSLHVGDPCDVVAGSGGRAHRAPLGDLGAAHHRHSGGLRGRWQKPDCRYDGGHSEAGRASLGISRRRSPGYSRRPALRGRRRRPCPAHCHGVRREYCRSRLSRSQVVPELCVPGQRTPDHERLLAGEIEQLDENEWAVWKPRWSAFHRTRLHRHLADLGVDTIVVAAATSRTVRARRFMTAVNTTTGSWCRSTRSAPSRHGTSASWPRSVS